MSQTESSNIPVSEPKQRSTSIILGISLALIFALGAFMSGIQLGQGNGGPAQTAGLYNFLFPSKDVEAVDTEPDMTEFWHVWELLEQNYVSASSSQTVSVEERIQGAIDGLVDTYEDPYTVYLPPREATVFGEDVSGEFSGVGMEVGLRDGLVTIISPLPETPAASAGLLSGDIIIKIDEESTEDMRIDEAVRLIRGEKGTTVELVIFREGETGFLTIPVVRDTIEIPTTKTQVIDGVFVISLYSFNAISEEKMKDALTEFANSGTNKLVLDVRGNPGGFLQSAVSIASYFLPAGKVVVSQESGVEREEKIFRSRSRLQVSPFNPDNFVVLVDNGSASASEILAGALRDHTQATVIGSQTFGKGSVQQLLNLDDGSSLKVTVARWLTPNGSSISDGGLEPDIVIERTPAQRIAGEDPQLDAAVGYLNGEEIVSENFEEQFVVDMETGDEG